MEPSTFVTYAKYGTTNNYLQITSWATPQYQIIFQDARLTETKPFTDFIDQTRSKESTENKTYRLGYLINLIELPCQDKVCRFVLALMPLWVSKEDGKQTDNQKNPSTEEQTRQYKIQKAKKLYNEKIQKKKFGVIRLVYNDHHEVETIYVHQDNPVINVALKYPNLKIAAIVQAQFKDNIPVVYSPQNIFDDFELHKIKGRIRYYPNDQMYEEDLAKFNEDTLVPKVSLTDKAKNTILGPNHEKKSLKERIKGSLFGSSKKTQTKK